MGRRKTHEEFVAEVEAMVGDEYTAVGEYKGSNTKIKFKHNECGITYNVSPNAVLNGSRCPNCSVNARKTHEKFIAEVETLVGDEYTVVGDYVNSNTKIEMKHKSCGTYYNVKPSHFLSVKSRCPKCGGNQKKNTTTFKQEVFNLVQDEYKVLGEYENANVKIEMKHVSCGKEYSVTPANFTSNGRRCPKCYGTHKKNTESFKKEVFSLAQDEYAVIGEYINAKIKIEMEHKICGGRYYVHPSKFVSTGNRCPYCSSSKGEKTICMWLLRSECQFEREYRLSDCRYKKPLPFDFSVLNGKKVICLIEYDGEQHYNPVESWGGKTAFRGRQRKDAIKTKYCAENNIPLIRIPYWEYDNIDAILTERLLPLLYNADKHNAS